MTMVSLHSSGPPFPCNPHRIAALLWLRPTQEIIEFKTITSLTYLLIITLHTEKVIVHVSNTITQCRRLKEATLSIKMKLEKIHILSCHFLFNNALIFGAECTVCTIKAPWSISFWKGYSRCDMFWCLPKSFYDITSLWEESISFQST